MDESPEQFEFEEIDEQEVDIEHFVDLEGELISDALDFDEENESVPVQLTEGVEGTEPSKQTYEWGISMM